MNFRFTLARVIAALLGPLVCTLHASPVPTGKPTDYPDWWFERDVILRLPSVATKADPVWPGDYPASDDYAVVNLGQLKAISIQAAAELDAVLPPPGAGSVIHALALGWQSAPASGVTRDDFAILNTGQLKAVSALYYSRLADFGYAGPPLVSGQAYPWTSTGADDDSFASANLGQLKKVFSFKLAALDADADGLVDAWEIAKFGSITAQTGSGNADGDAYDNRTESLLGTNPLSTASAAASSSLSLVIYSPGQ